MELGPLGCGWIYISDSHNKCMEPDQKPNQRSLEDWRVYVNTSEASEALRTEGVVSYRCL